jgi:predicted lipoprotein with Yx(FWY)xxD motif
MNNDYEPFPNQPFPVYTLNPDHGNWWNQHRSDDRGRDSACQGTCAVSWPPVLTSGWPQAGPGVNQHAIGIIVRPDGTLQVTYHGRPLYLFNQDAYFGGASPVGTPGIHGAGALTPWGMFNTIPPLP